MLISAWLGAPVAAAIDVLFLATLACVIGREIIHGSSKQNLKILALIGLLLVGNVVFHLESMPEWLQRLRNAHRYRNGCLAHHGDRRTHHPELHTQLADASATGPDADGVQSL
jgi:hypothetical protein